MYGIIHCVRARVCMIPSSQGMKHSIGPAGGDAFIRDQLLAYLQYIGVDIFPTSAFTEISGIGNFDYCIQSADRFDQNRAAHPVQMIVGHRGHITASGLYEFA